MNEIIEKINNKLLFYGFNGKKFLKIIKAITKNWFKNDFKELKRQKGNDTSFEFGSMFPILDEKEQSGGLMKGHYFHQDLYVARKIFEAKPQKHLDIGSRTDGFVAHVAAFREIELIDIRNIESKVKNITFRQANLMELPSDLVNYCDSVSSLHAIEHFGLGRYGDPIDYFGHIKAIKNISNILQKNGIFYLSVPIGPQRINFNAHRVFSVKYLLDILSDNYRIISFSYINDDDNFIEDAKLTEENINKNFLCSYGCGIFILRKL